MDRIIVGPPKPTAATAGRAKVFRRAAQPKPIRVSDRDVQVLAALAEHRILSGEQLRRLVLRCGPARARRRLRALFDNRLVRRWRFPAYPGVPMCLYGLSKDGA